MKKSDVINMLFHREGCYDSLVRGPEREKASAFAPTNIALVKYWGKRDAELNLPLTSSLSITLPDKGATTTLSRYDGAHDLIFLNGERVGAETAFAMRLSQFLDLFRPEKKWFLCIEIESNVPIAAGLASSACGFASLVCALNDLFVWCLLEKDLSILARLGSGSAARSLWDGFVEWQAGVQPNGLDSVGVPIQADWPSLCVGILTVSEAAKPLSSREAMQRTVNSSLLYKNWPQKVAHDLALVKQAIHSRHFSLLAGTAESNALTMHATMLSSWPPICYFLPETVAAMHKIWELRREGLEVYFTQDAGPNLKLLFLTEHADTVRAHFPEVEVVRVF